MAAGAAVKDLVPLALGLGVLWALGLSLLLDTVPTALPPATPPHHSSQSNGQCNPIEQECAIG
jgi:hypothetical protein